MVNLAENDFFNILFNENETVCTSHTVFETKLTLRDERKASQFFVINPVVEKRTDNNVTALRNLVFECDTLSKPEQLVLVIKNLKMPFSTLVYSGNKSFHWIISLEEQIESRELYDYLWQWIANIIGFADPATKNPARLSRYPNYVRPDTGKIQKLLILKKRVAFDELESWLANFKDKEPVKLQNVVARPKAIIAKANGERSSVINLINWYVRDFLKKDFVGMTTHVRCPLCAMEDQDTSCDNLAIKGEQRYVHCFKDDSHNKPMLSVIHKLRRNAVGYKDLSI